MVRSKHLATAAMLGLLAGGGLMGCGHDREPLPADAVVLKQDKGVSTDSMSATVQHPGMVYVYDESDKKVLYTGRVQPGDSVTIDTFRDRIAIDGKVVSQPEMDDAHRYKIYFDEDHSAGARELNDGTTIRRETSETQVAPPRNPDGTVIRQETTERNPDGTLIRRETTEQQPPPANSGGTVIRRETTETQSPPPAR